jgi:hypothetical protein
MSEEQPDGKRWRMVITFNADNGNASCGRRGCSACNDGGIESVQCDMQQWRNDGIIIL